MLCLCFGECFASPVHLVRCVVDVRSQSVGIDSPLMPTLTQLCTVLQSGHIHVVAKCPEGLRSQLKSSRLRKTSPGQTPKCNVRG